MIRKIKIMVLLLGLSYAVFSQTIPRPQLDKFVGTWLYTNGNNSITFFFKKVAYTFRSDNRTEDILMGCHKYIKNGITIEDNSTFFNEVEINKKESIFSYTFNWETNLNKIYGTVTDPLHHTYQNIEVLYNPTTPATITFKIVGGPDVYINPVVVPGITLPTNFTLVKQ